VSFFGWLIVAYVGWAILSALRKSPAGKAASRAPQRPPPSQEEAHRRLLDTLGVTQGERIIVERPSAPADRTAVRLRRLPTKGEDMSSPEVALDHDDDVERVVRARRREVEARNHALAGEDHEAFDARVRQEPSAQDARPGTRDVRGDLRKLIVWQEILGRPVGMRDP
jgi:type IV secretory pathway VirB10-like protein